MCTTLHSWLIYLILFRAVLKKCPPLVIHSKYPSPDETISTITLQPAALSVSDNKYLFILLFSIIR